MDNRIASNRFPTTPQELDEIRAFAKKANKTFADGDALTVEVKIAWVEASSLPDPKDYIMTTAIIPNYDIKPNSVSLVPQGSKQALLAMVGMHIVGSVAGHPEMVWATFEHVGNTPNAAYSYINTKQETVKVPQEASGTWLFCASNPAPPFNIQRNRTDDIDKTQIIVDTTSNSTTIGPSNIIRWRSWGVSTATSNGRPEVLNTDVILINSEVLSMLPAGDVRRNYVFEGATWTTGSFPNDKNQVGTNALANTTMETFQQGRNSATEITGNCFACHGDDGEDHGGHDNQPFRFNEISHFFPLKAMLSLSFLRASLYYPA